MLIGHNIGAQEGMRFPEASLFLRVSLYTSIFYEVSAVLKANYLALAQRVALRPALLFDKSIFLKNIFLINIKESFNESWITENG